MMLHIPAQLDLRDHDLRMRGIRLEGAFRMRRRLAAALAERKGKAMNVVDLRNYLRIRRASADV